MGVPASKATDSAYTAAQELEYVLRILERDPSDIYESGRISIRRCREILSQLPSYSESQDDNYDQA